MRKPKANAGTTRDAVNSGAKRQTRDIRKSPSTSSFASGDSAKTSRAAFGKDSGPIGGKGPVKDVRTTQHYRDGKSGPAKIPHANSKPFHKPSEVVNHGFVDHDRHYSSKPFCYSPRYNYWSSGCGWRPYNCSPWYGSGWNFSIGFSSYNWGFGFSYFDSYHCRPYYYSSWYSCRPYYWYDYCGPRVYHYSYYPWWSYGCDYGYYRPEYITNNYYYNYGSGYTTTAPSEYGPSQYNDYSWIEDNSAGMADDYSWLEADNSAPATRASESNTGLVEIWSVPQSEASPIDEGWTHLSDGDAHEARRAFLRAAEAAPTSGAAQIGLALSSAQLNRYTDAVVAMRKAVREDPESLNSVPNDEKVIQTIHAIIAHYKDQLKQTAFDVDALFMTAAMQYLIGQDALAYITVDDAIEHGDKDESAGQLKRLIREALNTSGSERPSTLNPGTLESPSLPPMSQPTTEPAPKQEVPF